MPHAFDTDAIRWQPFGDFPHFDSVKRAASVEEFLAALEVGSVPV